MGKSKVVAAAHRKFREGVATSEQLADLVRQSKADWLRAVSTGSRSRISYSYAPKLYFVAAAADIYLLATDALHLACATEQGFREINSNDGLPSPLRRYSGCVA